MHERENDVLNNDRYSSIWTRISGECEKVPSQLMAILMLSGDVLTEGLGVSTVDDGVRRSRRAGESEEGLEDGKVVRISVIVLNDIDCGKSSSVPVLHHVTQQICRSEGESRTHRDSTNP